MAQAVGNGIKLFTSELPTWGQISRNRIFPPSGVWSVTHMREISSHPYYW